MKNLRRGTYLAVLLAIVVALVVAGVASADPRERITIDTSDPVYLYFGADILFYSDEHATTTMTLDGAAGNITTSGAIDATGAIEADGTITAKGDLAVTGNLILGNGTAGVTQNGEDLYCEGTSEFDGAARFDGTVTQKSTVAMDLINIAGAGANPWDYTGTLAAMTNGDDFTLFDVNLTNGNHTGTTNTVQVLDIATITGDAETTETAINVAAGWDWGLTLADGAKIGSGYGSTGCTLTDAGVISCDGAATLASTLDVRGAVSDGAGTLELSDDVSVSGALAMSQINVAAAGANPIDYTGILAAMTSDDFTLFDVNITNADHTGANTVQVLDIATITPDAETTETAINVAAGWDWGMTLADGAKIGSGYGSSGCTISDAGVLQCNGAATTDGNLTALSGDFGGTYGTGTACSISSAGVLQCNGAMTTDGNLTALSSDIGGGYAGSGTTLTAAGTGRFDGNLVVDGTGGFTGTLTAAGALSVGGGYAGSGAAISDAGVGQFNGALTTDGALTAGSAVIGGGYGTTGATISAAGAISADGDVTLSADPTGGDLGAATQYIGLPRIYHVGLGTGTNGTVETVSYMDDSPANEWTTTSITNVVSSDSTTHVKLGTNALKLAFAATAVDDDGAVIDIVDDDLEAADDSIGFWMLSDVVLLATDVKLMIDDTDADTDLSTCATEINKWVWCEVSITALTGGNGNVVDKIGLRLKNAAVLGAFNLWVDTMFKWDAADEEALTNAAGTALDVLVDGDLGFVNAASGAQLVPYTNYLINYQTGGDVIVYISDFSAVFTVGLVAY